MTYGQIRHRLQLMFPGYPLDLIEGAIHDRYAEVIDELPWSSQNVQSVLQTTAPYATGTVEVTEGGTAVTLTGGTWTSGMTGRAFRVDGRSEIYEFTFGSASTGTLDRPYEGTSGTGAAYTLAQYVYPLPANCRLLEDDAFGILGRFSHGQLEQISPTRDATGEPAAWASYMEDGSTPPTMQVELYPIPDAVYSLRYTYVAEADALTLTSAVVKVWVDPTTLIEGAIARIKRHLKDYTGSELAEKAAERGLAGMRASEAHGMGAAMLRLDSYYTSHRNRRGR